VKRAGPALALLACCLAACDTASQHRARLADPQPPPGPVTHALDVGSQRVEITLPAKWSHLDRDGTHVFRRSIGTFTVEDLGPVTREGFRDAIARARDAFLAGDPERVQAILRTVDLRGKLGESENGRELLSSWNEILRADPGRTVDSSEVLSAYEKVLLHVFRLEFADPDEALAGGIPRLGYNHALREVASTERRTVGGREALIVETWNRRNHDRRKRHLFVLNDGYLFLARMETGRLEDLGPAFDELVDSLELRIIR
jgi:hypothetical protein